LALVVAITFGSCAIYLGGFSPEAVALAFGIGFFAGLVISLAVGWPRRAPSPEAASFLPPAWISVPVGIAVLVLLAYALIDESLRQGYFDGHRRRRGYYRIPGPLAIGVGCCCMIVAGLISLGAMWGRQRNSFSFVGGLLGIVVLIVGLCLILVRVGGHFD